MVICRKNFQNFLHFSNIWRFAPKICDFRVFWGHSWGRKWHLKCDLDAIFATKNWPPKIVRIAIRFGRLLPFAPPRKILQLRYWFEVNFSDLSRTIIFLAGETFLRRLSRDDRSPTKKKTLCRTGFFFRLGRVRDGFFSGRTVIFLVDRPAGRYKFQQLGRVPQHEIWTRKIAPKTPNFQIFGRLRRPIFAKKSLFRQHFSKKWQNASQNIKNFPVKN